MAIRCLAVACWALNALAARAGTVDWSGLGAMLTRADQTPAPAGSLVRIGTFNLSDSELASNTNTLTRLARGFVELHATTVGCGVLDAAGYWTTSFSGDFSTTYASLANRQIYLWTFDADLPAAATAHGIYRFDGTFPNDDPIPGQEAVDLGQLSQGQGTVLVGGLGPVSTNGVPRIFMAAIPVSPPPPPSVNFTASATVVVAGVPVSFTDFSTGAITNYLWAFGDGTTSGQQNPGHAYLTPGAYSVGLTATGPGGSATTNFPQFITVTSNSGPTIVTAPVLTNAVLQTDTIQVGLAGREMVFHAVAVDPDSDPVTYLWDFGDGTTGAGAFASHTYTNCRSFTVTLSVTDSMTTNSRALTAAVPCGMAVTSLQLKSKFTAPNSDSVKLGLVLHLPPDFHPAGRTLLVDVGGARDVFVMDAKNTGAGRFGRCKLKFDRKAKAWRLAAALKGGTWNDDWTAFGLHNATIPKTAPVTVSVPVVVLSDTAAFMDEPSLAYTAIVNKSGTARK